MKQIPLNLFQVGDIIESRRIISKYIKHNNFTVIPVDYTIRKM